MRVSFELSLGLTSFVVVAFLVGLHLSLRGDVTSPQSPNDCSFNGHCVDRRAGASGSVPLPVCVCEKGFWGADCQRTVEDWDRIADLQSHRQVAQLHGGHSMWWYLNSTAYRSRYVLAANSLRTCRHILEIGGFVSPIDEFLHPDSLAESVAVVDPLIQPYAGYDMQGRQILHLPTTLAQYPLRGDEDAWLFLGVPKEFPIALVTTLPMSTLIKTIVVEGAHEKTIQTILDHIIDLTKERGFRSLMDITLDMSRMADLGHPEISRDPDNNHRRLVVLERGLSF